MFGSRSAKYSFMGRDAVYSDTNLFKFSQEITAVFFRVENATKAVESSETSANFYTLLH
jgi:hypothetical protein